MAELTCEVCGSQVSAVGEEDLRTEVVLISAHLVVKKFGQLRFASESYFTPFVEHMKGLLLKKL